jgi:hypothetical protein
MNLLPFLPARQALPARLALLAVVALGLALLTALMLAGLRDPGAAGVLATMWVLGVAGLACQGAIGLLLLRGHRPRRRPGARR